MKIKLVTGATYNKETLDLIEWDVTLGDKNTEDTEGFNMHDYFDADGVYQGPDKDGVEPVFAVFDMLQ